MKCGKNRGISERRRIPKNSVEFRHIQIAGVRFTDSVECKTSEVGIRRGTVSESENSLTGL